MIGAAELLARAAALTPVPNPNSAAVQNATTGLRSRRVPKDSAFQRLRYPGREEGLADVAAALEAARRRSSDEFAMLADILRDPVRGYPTISDSATASHVLLGAWRLPDGSSTIGVASVAERPAQALSVTFEAIASPSPRDLTQRLERLFRMIQPAARSGDLTARLPRGSSG